MAHGRPQRHRPTYTLWDELLASPTEPLPPEKRRHQLTRMLQGLAAMETGAQPSTDDWRVVADAVNLMETLVGMGELADTSGMVADAVAAMARAGRRHVLTAAHLRLDAADIQTLRGLLEDYATALDALPARTMVRAHRLTEKRLQEIIDGKRRPHDVEVVAP